MDAPFLRSDATPTQAGASYNLNTPDYGRRDAVRLVFARTLFTTSEWIWRDLDRVEHLDGWLLGESTKATLPGIK